MMNPWKQYMRQKIFMHQYIAGILSSLMTISIKFYFRAMLRFE